MSLKIAVSRARQLNSWLERYASDLELPKHDRSRSAGGNLAASIDHFKGVCLLSGGNAYGSAFALIRVQWEAYLNGVWLWHCATDVQVRTYVEGARDLPGIEKRVKAIARTPGFDDGIVSDLHARNIKSMHDYAHSGSLVVQRWNSDDTIEPCFPDREIEQMLTFTGSTALLAANSMLVMAQDKARSRQVAAKMQEYTSSRAPTPLLPGEPAPV